MTRCLAAFLVALAPGLPAAAQDQPARATRSGDIPVEEWVGMAMGRTLTYRIDGAFFALEYYHPGGNRVTLKLFDGTCQHGTWEYSSPLYCFHWEGQAPVCFRHVREGDEIVIIQTLDGTDTGVTQRMTAVTDLPLACGPDLTS